MKKSIFSGFRPIRALHPAGTYANDSADTIDILSQNACQSRDTQKRNAGLRNELVAVMRQHPNCHRSGSGAATAACLNGKLCIDRASIERGSDCGARPVVDAGACILPHWISYVI